MKIMISQPMKGKTNEQIRKEREIVIQAPSYGGIEILKNKNIKSIVTKEQFGYVSYKIEV